MDIKHLIYFMAVVKHNFNLSQAAESLYIVQPTLSVMINNFEKDENICLFNRKKGRIVSLTQRGETFYQDALEVIDKYNLMMRNVRLQSNELRGNINIGVPPIFLSVIFGEILPEMIINHPNIQFNIIEEGASSLSNKLLAGQIEIASLLSPEGISHNVIESYEFHVSELVLFMSKNHVLADKDLLKWDDLTNQKFATLDQNYMISNLFIQRCNLYNIYPNVIFQSSSYEILFDLVNRNSDLITVMQWPAEQLVQHTNVVAKRIEHPIPWKATLCRLKKHDYSPIENFIFTELVTKLKEKHSYKK